MSRPVYILGLNAYHGDAAAALLRDGVLVAAVEEERLRRVKHWAGFPALAIRAVLREGGIRGSDLACVAVGRNPRAHVARKVAFTLRRRPAPKLIAERWRHTRAVQSLGCSLAEALEVPDDRVPSVHHVEHHRAHLASAFFVSPFPEAACVAVDGFGDFVSTSMGIGCGAGLEILDRVHFPHSLGILYTAITQYLGFPSYGDEYKVMALAAYGRPSRVREIRQLVRLTDAGGFELSLPFFRHWSTGAPMQWSGGAPTLERLYTAELEALLGPSRVLGDALEARHADIACSLQAVYETSLIHVLTASWERTHTPQLCLAGGCALNAVANGKIRARTPFREVYIPPAAGDAGTAIGAAYDAWHSTFRGRRGFAMDHAFWGRAYDEDAIRAALDEHGVACDHVRYESLDDVARAAAERIAAGDVVGWYQGRMEWGARALGHRSIVADPRRADVRDRINARVKGREAFRPFAPSIAVEAVADYFVDAVSDPFMTQACAVRPDKRSVIPAVTHVDGTARLHAVRRETEPEFHALITAFGTVTGVPVLLNTSLNEHEPIVDTPAQALDTFVRTGLDAIVLGTTLVRRVGVVLGDTGGMNAAPTAGAFVLSEA